MGKCRSKVAPEQVEDRLYCSILEAAMGQLEPEQSECLGEIIRICKPDNHECCPVILATLCAIAAEKLDGIKVRVLTDMVRDEKVVAQRCRKDVIERLFLLVRRHVEKTGSRQRFDLAVQRGKGTIEFRVGDGSDFVAMPITASKVVRFRGKH